MPSYIPPVKEFKFILEEVLNIYQYKDKVPSLQNIDVDLIDNILNQVSTLIVDKIVPTNLIGDEQGCVLENGQVKTPDVYKEIYQQWTGGGWSSLNCDEKWGGQEMPHTLMLLLNEMLTSANMAFSMFTALTTAAIQTLLTWAPENIKELYIPNMVSGKWSGVMSLTEPHCGTDLGLIRTKAEPMGDDTYKVSGTKIFISAGEHDLTENIIHLVLARIVGAPDGTKGLTLFIVPKILINSDSSLNKPNQVTVGSIEKKMGIKSSPTCVMNFDGATGWVIGSVNKGLNAMFTMMNEARIGVAMHGIALSEVAYQNAAAYANDRVQGQALSGAPDKTKKADPIIVHQDIRRILLTIRSFNEGARALLCTIQFKTDLLDTVDHSLKQEYEEYLSLITPVVKGYFTDKGYLNTNEALQVFGGHGYIHEWGMEQFVRDARITQIYEGTSNIQALDLIGRKLPKAYGRFTRTFFHPVSKWLQENSGDPELKEFTTPLLNAFSILQQATGFIIEKGMVKAEDSAAGAVHYMHMFGIVAIAYQWGLIAQISLEKLRKETQDPEFYEDKLILARFFMEQTLPDVASLFTKIKHGAGTIMAMKAERFINTAH